MTYSNSGKAKGRREGQVDDSMAVLCMGVARGGSSGEPRGLGRVGGS